MKALKDLGEVALEDAAENDAINFFYETTDYSYQKDPTQQLGRIYDITKEQLKIGDHLFELVGSEFYLYIRNDVPHLILKNAKNILRGKDLTYNVKGEEEFPQLNLWELINQRPILQIYNKQIELKDKITQGYKFNISIKPLIQSEKISSFEYVYVRYEGVFDSICEVIEIPKKALSISEAADAIQIENLILQKQRADEDLALKKREMYRLRDFENID